jgi:iron complex outermembrane receptor protein
MDTPRMTGLALISLTCFASGANANEEELTELDFSALQRITVTSVSKKEERLLDAAAPITVLSNDDLRRSGATTVAEALRLAPGMNVSTVNSSRWAISSRGFAGVLANKLLVLVDGRAVYTPLFAGVYWYLQQTMLEDVDRIEVIRGPGATVWGANAVNGVINIVTRSAKDTQGALAFASAGDVQKIGGGLRYGTRNGENTYWRVFAESQTREDFPLPGGASGSDRWQTAHAGLRMDRDSTPNTHLTGLAEVSKAKLDHGASDAYNVNTLARWTRKLSNRSSFEAQAYYDRTHIDEVYTSVNTVDTADLSLQHTLGAGERNDVIWGVNYRHIQEKVGSTNDLVRVRNDSLTSQLFSVFLQDEFALIPDRLMLIAGSKLEHNGFTGFELQPSIKGVFKPTPSQTIWSAVSRAVRTPSEIEDADVFTVFLGPPFPGPGGGLYVPAIVGNAEPDSEVLRAYEMGYRAQFAQRVTLDIATFYNEYERLMSFGQVTAFVPGIPFGIAELPWLNTSSAETYGGEVALTLMPRNRWRLTATYSLLAIQTHGPLVVGLSDPKHQASLRSFHDFANGVSLDAQLRYAERVRVPELTGGLFTIPTYVTADLRLSYRPAQKLELSLMGQNLFDKQHVEQAQGPFWPRGEVPRSLYGKITWYF